MGDLYMLDRTQIIRAAERLECSLDGGGDFSVPLVDLLSEVAKEAAPSLDSAVIAVIRDRVLCEEVRRVKVTSNHLVPVIVEVLEQTNTLGTAPPLLWPLGAEPVVKRAGISEETRAKLRAARLGKVSNNKKSTVAA